MKPLIYTSFLCLSISLIMLPICALAERQAKDIFNAPKVSNKTPQSPIKHKKFGAGQDYAYNLYQRVINGDDSAVEELRLSANNGDRWSALQYGYLAHTGKLPGLNGRVDIAQAIKAYKKSSEQVNVSTGKIISKNGNYLAAYNIGLIYYYGQGVPVNGAEALKWFKASSVAYPGTAKIFWPAKLYIAQILEKGYGVAKDEREAYKAWQDAAKANETTGMYGQAMSILRGRGALHNPLAAYPLLLKAANRWNVNAMVALSQYQAKGDKFREPNVVDAAKWLMIASVIEKKYTTKAEAMMAQLSKEEQKKAYSATKAWLSTHGYIPEEFDYQAPLNKDAPKRK